MFFNLVIFVSRASNAARLGGDIYPIEPDKPRLVPSIRQVHPVCDDKAQLIVFDRRPSVEKKRPTLDLNASPPPYPKRASLDSNPSPTAYPLAPNICVEAGRIEFVKQSPDGVVGFPDGVGTPPTTPRIGGRITVTRGQQTADEEFDEAKVSGATVLKVVKKVDTLVLFSFRITFCFKLIYKTSILTGIWSS